jgi:hypothetical protein
MTIQKNVQKTGKNRQIYFSAIILLAMLLIVTLSSAAFADDVRWLKLSTYYDKDGLHLSRADVISNTPYYSNYFLPGLVPDKLDYEIVFYQGGAVIKRVTPQFMHTTLVEYSTELQAADKVEVRSLGRRLISSLPLAFCDFDKVCEPCLSDDCIAQENELSCPDCLPSAEDGYCAVKDDNLCDVDCVPGYSYPGFNSSYPGCYELKLFKTTCEDFGYTLCPADKACTGISVYMELTSQSCCKGGACVDKAAVALEEAASVPAAGSGANTSAGEEPGTAASSGSGLYAGLAAALILIIISIFLIIRQNRKE